MGATNSHYNHIRHALLEGHLSLEDMKHAPLKSGWESLTSCLNLTKRDPIPKGQLPSVTTLST